MSPRRSGSYESGSPSRNARAAATSVYPRRTRTLAVNSLIPSSWANSATVRCGHAGSVQVPSIIVVPRYGGRRTTYSAAVRELFLRDRAVVYLNHGSYGACPRPVSERYQPWQRELE